MKWYFACNEKSENFFPLIKGAVNSALENTTLEPHFIYYGEENELTKWLSDKGAKIVHHRVSFYEEIKDHYDEISFNVASGAFLRCDIPIIENDDEFVLYTDCDVLFLKDFDIEKLKKPEYFSCSSQFTKHNFVDFNTGVMLMNVKKLKESHAEFIEFIKKNLSLFNSLDQTAYQIFYHGKNTNLPVIYNHKPYWGVDNKAVILHFHGSKPTNFVDEDSLKHFRTMHYKLYKKNPEAYDFYLELFKKYHDINYNYDAIKKLKVGIFPLDKGAKNPINVRIRHKISKLFAIFRQRYFK